MPTTNLFSFIVGTPRDEVPGLIIAAKKKLLWIHLRLLARRAKGTNSKPTIAPKRVIRGGYKLRLLGTDYLFNCPNANCVQPMTRMTMAMATYHILEECKANDQMSSLEVVNVARTFLYDHRTVLSAAFSFIGNKSIAPSESKPGAVSNRHKKALDYNMTHNFASVVDHLTYGRKPPQPHMRLLKAAAEVLAKRNIDEV